MDRRPPDRADLGPTAGRPRRLLAALVLVLALLLLLRAALSLWLVVEVGLLAPRRGPAAARWVAGALDLVLLGLVLWCLVLAHLLLPWAVGSCPLPLLWRLVRPLHFPNHETITSLALHATSPGISNPAASVNPSA